MIAEANGNIENEEEHLSFVIDEPKDETELSAEDEECLVKNVEKIKEFLNAKGYHFDVRAVRKDIVKFNMCISTKNKLFNVSIITETNPNTCCISVRFPFAAQPLYVYPICYLLAKENSNSVFGVFKYDERSGEITCEQSFSIEHGVDKDELDCNMHSVVENASRVYAVLRKICTGRFKDDDAAEILKNVKALIAEIDTY